MTDNKGDKYVFDSPQIHSADSYDGSGYESSENPERRASVAKIKKVSSILMVLVSGLALFSDGYNAQVRIA